MTMEQEPWYQFLDEDVRDLVNLSYSLFNAFVIQPSSFSLHIHDYSFIVFPMAKAYEGFLKKWLFRNGFIDEGAYRSDHFRIGKALNPSLPPRFKDEQYVYDRIVVQCPNPNLADRLWNAWKEGRNLIFHYFPHLKHALSLSDATARIDQLAQAMKDAVGCGNVLL